MGMLFLDPVTLVLLLGLLVYVCLVWRGTVRRWFTRPGFWTVLAWPVPLLADGLLWLAGELGVEVSDGDVADAALYAAVYLVPAAALAVWPPRWLLPAWARGRITPLPRDPGWDVPVGAMPAVQGQRGHGSRARWVWRVDGVAGAVWLDGSTLRFRGVPAQGRTASLEVDDEAVAELRFSTGGELRLEAPRGGSWGRSHLDVVLGEVDRVSFRAVVLWWRDGLATFEVAGRRPALLWVADIRRLERLLVAGAEDRPA